MSFNDALVRVCKEHIALPTDDWLLSQATGEELEKIVELLVPTAQSRLVLQDQDREVMEASKRLKALKDKRRQYMDALGLRDEKKKGAVKADPDWEQDELSLPVESDPRKLVERHRGTLDVAVLASIAGDCLADAGHRLITDLAATLPRALKAMQHATKLVELCKDLEQTLVLADNR
jgi:hypothetical protein